VAVAAMIFRAVYKLAESILCDHDTKEFKWDRGFIFMFNFFTAMMGLNFFASLAISGIMNALFVASTKYSSYWIPLRAGGYIMAAGTIAGFYTYAHYYGKPDSSITGDNTAGAGTGTDYGSLFILGLIAGCVSFGGAYTTIPFIYNIAVTKGGWVTASQFLDAIAIVNMLPTPLVSFVATIGFIGHGIWGAVLMLIGIFLPATILPIMGHELIQKVVDNDFVQPFLEGIASAVLGLLIQTALQVIYTYFFIYIYNYLQLETERNDFKLIII
jgi:chromate transporter